jgi:hypothetical protein
MAPATGEARGAITTSDPNTPRPGSVSDAEIDRTAHLWLERHGAAAVAEARIMAAALKRRGDVAGADAWLRLIVALEQRTQWRGR